MTEQEIKNRKVDGETAIPTGTYQLRMDIVSPKYSKKLWYYHNCNGGRLPRIMNVPGFDGILIHAGNTAQESCGCILVGKNTIKGKVTNSKATFLNLYSQLYKAYKKGEKITVTIK